MSYFVYLIADSSSKSIVYNYERPYNRHGNICLFLLAIEQDKLSKTMN